MQHKQTHCFHCRRYGRNLFRGSSEAVVRTIRSSGSGGLDRMVLPDALVRTDDSNGGQVRTDGSTTFGL